jgi:hypothetical protein
MAENTSTDLAPITLRITYTAADLMEGVRMYQRSTRLDLANRIISIAGLLVVGWGLFLLAIDYFLLPNIFEGEYRLGLLEPTSRYLIWIIVVLGPLSVVSWFRPFRLFGVWLDFQRNKANYQKPYEVNIGPEAISVKTLDAEGRQLWSAFEKVLESERLFVLVYGSWLYAMLPKRDFPDPESIEEYRNFLQSRIDKYRSV